MLLILSKQEITLHRLIDTKCNHKIVQYLYFFEADLAKRIGETVGK